MSLLSRITSGKTTRVQDLHVSQGGPILIGRQASGAGKAQEIAIGSGLSLSGLTLSATGGAWSEISGKPTVFPTNTANIADITSDGATNPGKALKTDADGLLTVDIIDAASSVSAPSITIPANTGFYSTIGSPTGLSANKAFTTATTEGTLAITGRADGRVSYSDLVNLPTMTPLTSSKVVANAAARLALSTGNAQGFAVVEADTGDTYMLIAGGNPATSGDWTKIGDRNITASEVSFSSVSAKTTPVDADTVPLVDSAASGAWKLLSWANIKATLKTFFDTLYVALSQLSTVGGANKVMQADASGVYRIGPVNSTNNTVSTGGTLRIPDRQTIEWEDASGNIVANLYLQGNHSNGAELLANLERGCIYWNHGFQLGQAGSARSKQFLYFQSYGQADAGDPTREGVCIGFDGEYWDGARRESTFGWQWVPSGNLQGEFQFGIWPSGYTSYDVNGKMRDISGVVRPLSITHTGLKLHSGMWITFADSTTLSSMDDVQDLIDAAIAPRAATTTLVAGTRTITEASVTAYTTVQLTRKTAGGTTGDLTYALNPGVGFTINSTSATDTSRVAYLLTEGAILNLTPPSISGTNEIGDTLTVTDNEATGSRQWYSNGVAVSGQTGSTYAIRAADIGADITCSVGGINSSNSITAWHPDDETGLAAFFTADAGLYDTTGGSGGNAVTTHGANVVEWRDQSGSGNHVANSTSNQQPTLDLTTESGYPNLLFDGNSSHSDYLFRNYGIPQSGGPHTLPQTAYVVAKTISVGANRRLFTTGEAGQRMLLAPDGSSDILNSPATTADNNVYPHGQRSIITGRATTSNSYVRVDGGTEYSASATNTVGNGLWIGAASATSGINGRVYAALFYRADHDSSAQARVRKYLKAKWNTP